MTDLIFLLLVFFVLATTLINPNNAVKLTLPSSSSAEGDPSTISLSIVGESNGGYLYVINGRDEYRNVEAVAAALQQEYSKYAGVAEAERPYISLRCDEKVTVDTLVEIIDITRENKYKMVLATKDK